MKMTIYFLILFILFSCSPNTKQTENSSTGINSSYSNSSSENSDNANPASDNNYHTDSKYKYEHRTGISGEYEYNYDISGYDEDGNSVYGNIDIQGKSGSGYIYDEDGNEKYIDVEWVDYGVLEGTDEDGKTYELEVDD